nr:putative reverse transcriptase domain-containing protein [Tanacetum cinerariifolium]
MNDHISDDVLVIDPWEKIYPREITQINYESGNEKGRIELKGRFFTDLCDNAFSGTNGEGVIEHIEDFLEIVDMLNIPNVSNNHLRVRAFPFSLSGAASKCNYDCEIRYHLGKANVVADVLSRKERVKPKQVRAMSMKIQSGIKEKLLAAQNEATKEENAPVKMLHGLDQQMEKNGDGGLYFMDRIWVPLIGDLRTIIMDETHATRYSIHPRADKMY